MKKMNFQPGASLPIATIIDYITDVRRGGLDLQPEYQRDYIWNTDFKDKLIFSIFKKYPIGSVIIRNLDKQNVKGARQEVVDGQQRLTTIADFYNKEFAISAKMSSEIIKEIEEDFRTSDSKICQKIYKKYLEGKKFKLPYDALPERAQRNFANYPVAIISISDATDEEVSEYFRYVQNQERLRAGEIINSFPESILSQYLDKINEKEGILRIINFPDNRKEFDKIFYSIIGLLEQKINFGVTDNVIRDYVSSVAGKLNENVKKEIDNIIKNLNAISKLENLEIATNKRSLKFMLLLMSKNYINEDNLEDSLKKLDKINVRLSAFNSAKKNIIADTFPDIDENIIEKYRGVALLSKGAHSYENVFKEIEILNQLLLDYENVFHD